MWLWPLKMPTQNLLRFLFLLMLMMRIVLATACCRYGSGGLVIKLNFCSDFEQKVWSLFWSWSSGKIWSRSLFSILLLMFWSGNEVESWSRFWSQVWSISWILSLVEILMFADVEILKLVLGQYSLDDLIQFCVWSCDITKISYFGRPNSTLGSVVPLAMFWLDLSFAIV